MHQALSVTEENKFVHHSPVRDSKYCSKPACYATSSCQKAGYKAAMSQEPLLCWTAVYMLVPGSASCCGSHPGTDHSEQYTSHRTQVRHDTLVYTLDMESKMLAPNTSAAKQSAAVTAPPGQTCLHGLTLVWLGWVQQAGPHPEPQLHPQLLTGPPELALPLSTNPTGPQPSPHSSLPHSVLPGPARYMHVITGQNICAVHVSCGLPAVVHAASPLHHQRHPFIITRHDASSYACVSIFCCASCPETHYMSRCIWCKLARPNTSYIPDRVQLAHPHRAGGCVTRLQKDCMH